MRLSIASAIALVLAAATGTASAVERCELNGESVNPNNGNTTSGKTGLMRCREGDSGPVVREQELREGVFMGVVRYFKDSALEREYRVNERGNRDGLAREWARAENGAKPVLVREETYRNGSTIGLMRSWYPSGQLRRVGFHDDADHEIASAEFTAQGKLADLRCAARAVLGVEADDARWCGHAGPSNVVFYSGSGTAKARITFERGERRKSEYLSDNGVVRELLEVSPTGGLERQFYADGTRRHEAQWVASADGTRSRRTTTLDQEFHESGKLVHERRWKVGERGGELVSEQHWYLNGQPKDRTDYTTADGKTVRQEVSFHDNGQKAFEGTWQMASISARTGELASGVHKSFDSEGHLRAERVYDARGRVARERSLDAGGTVVRDDEVFEDGSRKAFGK